MSSSRVLKFGFPALQEKDPLTGDTLFRLRPKDIQMADLFALALKVDYEKVMSTDGEFGRMLSNGTLTGTLGLVQREEVDMAMCDLAITEERMKGADFSYPYFFDSFSFATKTPEFAPKFLTIVYPFTKEVWFCMLACFVLINLLFYSIVRQKCSFAKVVLKTFGSFFNQTNVFTSQKTKDRILILFWEIGSMIITFSYTAVLLSFLTLPIRERGIQTIRELSDAVVKKEYHVGTFKGNYIPEVLRKSKEEYLRIIGKDVKNHLIAVSETKDALLHWDEKMALIVPRNYAAFLQNRIFMSEDNFFQILVAIPYKKSFCCKNQLEEVSHRIFEAGLYAKINKDFVFKTFLQRLSPEERFEKVIEMKLGLRDMSGAFGILLIGYVISVSAFIVETLICRSQKCRKPLKAS